MPRPCDRVRVLCAAAGCAACLFGQPSPSPASTEDLPSGNILLEHVEKRPDSAQRSETLKIRLIEPDGTTRDRTARVFRRRQDDGVRILFVFDSPPNIRGTALLIVDYDDPARDDDRWIYLPALRKSRRIGAGERGQTFLGTDFTYEEIRNDARFKSSEMSLEVKSPGEHEGRPCFDSRLQITSASYARDLGYERIDACIDKDSSVPVTMQMYDASGKNVKSIRLDRLQSQKDVWLPMYREAQSADGHKTILETTAVDLTTPLPDDLFSEDGLQRGGR